MKIGDLVEYKISSFDNSVAVITNVGPNPHDSVSYKIWITWANGVEDLQWNWRMKVVS
jgi:hypothetical protein